jgi:hypothetical protein
MTDRLRCTHCDDVIGVYEPLIAVLDGAAVDGSRVSRPDLGRAAVVYHRDCYARLQAGGGTAAQWRADGADG